MPSLGFTKNLLVLAVSATLPSYAQPPERYIKTPAEWSLNFNGIGPVKLGMTPAQLKWALRPDVPSEEESGNESCYYLRSTTRPQLYFMVTGERIVRIDVKAAGIPTSEGVQVGDSEAKAKIVYGTQLKVGPHAYTSDGHYLTALEGWSF